MALSEQTGHQHHQGKKKKKKTHVFCGPVAAMREAWLKVEHSIASYFMRSDFFFFRLFLNIDAQELGCSR